MLIIFLLIILVAIFLLLYILFKVAKWTLKESTRTKWAISILTTLVLVFVVKRVFFTKMEFVQSNVYSNLYIVKNPEKEYSEVKNAIFKKIKEHLKTKHKTGKQLSYSGENAIYFYEDGGMTFGFLGEAGTSYFIDHEEDLGGFVTEELGMYQKYLIAEFYYEPSSANKSSICGELNLFHEGEFVKADTICNLEIID